MTVRVSVTWLDILGDPKWMSVEEALALEPVVATTEGYLLYRDESKIIIAGSRISEGLDDDTVSGLTVVPVGCVKSIRTTNPTLCLIKGALGWPEGEFNGEEKCTEETH